MRLFDRLYGFFKVFLWFYARVRWMFGMGRVRSVEGVTIVTRISRNGAALISGVVLTNGLFHSNRSGDNRILSSGSLRHRHNVAVLSGGISVG